MIGILTEKPSVARDIATAIGITKNSDGYFDGKFNGDDYVVTNCLGHLLELSHPEDYDPALKEWKIETLPILPNKFKRYPLADTKKQLAIIKKALKDCSEIIIATDAGREGELIGRSVLSYLGLATKSLKRFWTSNALTPDVVRATLENVKPASAYNKLYEESLARAQADWIVGINYTRFFTKCTDTLYSIGRVQTALLAIIADNHKRRQGFVKQKYYQLIGTFQTENNETFEAIFTLDDNQRFDKPFITRLFTDDHSETGVIEKYAEKRITENPPQLYSLTALQRDMNKMYKFPAKKTLELAQNLYEAKIISYPRTPSSVMGNADVALIEKTLAMLKSKVGGNIFTDCSVDSADKRIFNDAKLEDHHAMIPLKVDVPDNEDERRVYNTIIRRFALSLNKPALKLEQTIVVRKFFGLFCAKSTSYFEKGFTRFIEQKDEVQPLPKLAKDDIVKTTHKEIKEGETAPPNQFTESTLLGVMERPNRILAETDPRFESGAGIGTPATRAAIIETLKSRKYIDIVKNNIEITSKGEQLIDIITPKQISITNVAETALWEVKLKEDPIKFYEEVVAELTSTINRLKADQKEISDEIQSSRTVLGTCPHCHEQVLEYDKYWGCKNNFAENRCLFKVWKEQNGGKVSEANARKILKDKKSDPITFVSKQKKKPFTACLVVLDSGEVKISFDDVQKEAIGKCKKCGANVLEREKFFGCSNWQSGCDFKLWKNTFGTTLTATQASQLLSDTGLTSTIKLKNKEGKQYSAKLMLDNDSKVKVKLG